jgi:hypothetical protein
MQFNAGSLLFCCFVHCRIKIRFYICQTKTHKNIQTMNTATLELQKIESTFVTMVKIEMLLSGNTFEVAKETVKQYLRSQGLM